MGATLILPKLIVPLVALSACAEIERPIGRLNALARAGEGGESAESGAQGGEPNSGVGAVASAGASSLACQALGRCDGDLAVASMGTAADGGAWWVATAVDACEDPFPRLTARDACDELRLVNNGPVYFMGSPSVRLPLIRLDLRLESADSSEAPTQFEARALLSGQQEAAFSAACRSAWHPALSCPELGRQLSGRYFPDARCFDDGQGGCLCDYTLQLQQNVEGPLTAADGVLAFAKLGSADYCSQATALQLRQHDGEQLLAGQAGSLFSQAGGPRSVTLHPASCADGVQDGDEDGVDCNFAKQRLMLGAAACPDDCTATCVDATQNQQETGVDCGGPCRDLCSCFNGLQDPWEEGPDCGGPCALSCMCVNGVQDDGEDGVDCGGGCTLRFGEGPVVPKKCP